MLETSKNSTFEVPPPGLGFDTVTEAVLTVAMLVAGTVAVNCEAVTKVVARAVPFQLTTELETKAVPLMVSVKPDPPGAALMGTRGWLMKGTGFVCTSVAVLARSAISETR